MTESFYILPWKPFVLHRVLNVVSGECELRFGAVAQSVH